MKRNVIFLICLIASIVVFGQNETKHVEVDEVQVTPPKFTGVLNAMALFEAGKSPINNYLAKNFVCPTETAQCSKEGTEIIQFTVTPDGWLTNFKVINSVCRIVDDEMIRILKNTNGMWMPGYNNGEPTAMEQEVSLMIGDYSKDKMVNHFVKQAKKYCRLGNTTLLVEHKPKKALKYYNKGVKYVPSDKSLLSLRGLCHYELGDKESARKDWNRITSLGGINPNEIAYEINEMKGFSEMTEILDNNKKD
ncbi:MAG: energy transducer TonB [Bacteroidota bacterium]